MGTSDLLKPVIEHELKGTIHFGRVNVKPGKPTTFATVPTPGGRNEVTPIFALPGNPASALVTFHVFVVPALRRLSGLSGEACHLPRIRVKVSSLNSITFQCELKHRSAARWYAPRFPTRIPSRSHCQRTRGTKSL